MNTLFDLTDAALRPLFGEPTARATDPATSHAAAGNVRPGSSRALALVALNSAGTGGLTDFELAARTGVPQTSIGVRRKELSRAGLVEATDERRPSPSGTPAIVWRITHAGGIEARRVVAESHRDR